MPRLILKSGDRAGMEFEVREETVIGRQTEAGIFIPDVKASRSHAKVTIAGDEFLLFDLDSTNGTYVNGSLTKQTRLRHGDVIKIGSTEIMFHDPSAAPAAAPPAPAAAPVAPVAPVAPAASSKRVDIGLPPPKKVRLDVPPAKTIKAPLKPTKRGRDRFKK